MRKNPIRKPIEAHPTCLDFDCNCIFICICICIYNRYGSRGVSAYVSVSICPINSQAKAKLAKLHARTYAYIYIHVYTYFSRCLPSSILICVSICCEFGRFDLLQVVTSSRHVLHRYSNTHNHSHTLTYTNTP